METELIKGSGQVTLRKGAAGQEVQIGESVSVAAAAQERAQLETAVTLAQMGKPRDYDVVRAKVLSLIEDPAIAELWSYSRPAGRRKNEETGEWEQVIIEGPSVRAAEFVNQAYGKTYVSMRHLHIGRDYVLIAATAYDLENLTAVSSDVMVEKTVERREPRKGEKVIGRRQNSSGEEVFVIETNAEQMKTKIAAERSKLFRDNVLRIVPRGLIEEAGEKAKLVLANANAKDPNAAKKKVFDRFASVGVTPDMLKSYLDRSLDVLTPKDIQELTFIFNGLKQGDFSWNDLLATKASEAEGEAPAPEAKKAQKLKEQVLAARDKAKAQEKTEEPPKE